MKRTMTVLELIEVLKGFNHDLITTLYADDKWVYPMELPDRLRDEGHNLMLHVMFQVEHKEGILIHIPNKNIIEKKENPEYVKPIEKKIETIPEIKVPVKEIKKPIKKVKK